MPGVQANLNYAAGGLPVSNATNEEDAKESPHVDAPDFGY